MSVNTVTSYSRFSDSLERELLDTANQHNRAYSVLEGLGMVASFIGRAASSFGRYLVQVAEALNDARARDARFTGSQW
ncbi:hypothetical protein [Yanghanlia caeni]|uniref:Uncharacterized protein n=1 Tax=Yanghanlia caeni TaxID=3064283 RepID=A0ABU1D4J9_9BURK|nr:hypothetical protein [Alcaligenaceae bacterium LG-2]NGR08363.1 hypothetical protein [bacterium SGD-2]HZH57577.1 hypothetical protein [Burkholderiaceae bacterium]